LVAAKRLGVSENTMRTIVQRGGIPVLRIGGKVLVLERDLDAYLAKSYGLSRPFDKAQRAPGSRLAPLPERVRGSRWLNQEKVALP
jgi:excisionase family DNA binding protein